MVTENPKSIVERIQDGDFKANSFELAKAVKEIGMDTLSLKRPLLY